MTQLAVLPLLEVVRDHAADPDLLHLLDHDPREHVTHARFPLPPSGRSARAWCRASA